MICPLCGKEYDWKPIELIITEKKEGDGKGGLKELCSRRCMLSYCCLILLPAGKITKITYDTFEDKKGLPTIFSKRKSIVGILKKLGDNTFLIVRDKPSLKEYIKESR